ncbi:Mucin-2-like [Neofusicoccum parvum]|nr:Mucin-2-like [Neofusicoccum parvum]
MPTAHTEESTDVEPPWWETSAPGFAHTENPGQPEQPEPTGDGTITATAHTELPTTLAEPGKPPVTAAPPTEVGTVLQPSPGTTAQGGGGGIGGVIGSLIESYISNGGPQATNVPAEPQQGAGNNSPAGTQAPAPPQNIPVGSTTVQVVPTAIPTIIAGTSTNVPAVIVGGTTLTAGQTVVVDNTPISVPTVNSPAPPNEQGQQNNQLQGQPQAPAVIIGGSSTVLLPTYAGSVPTPAPPALTIDGQTIQPTGSVYVISGQTVSPGSPITLGTGPSATVIALTTNAAGSSIVIVGSATTPYTLAAVTNAPAALTIGSQTIQPSGSVYIISGQTLTPGGTPITIGPASAPTILSLTTDAAGNTIAVVNGATQTLAPAAAAGTTALPATTPGPLVIYGSTILPTDGTAYVYQGQTLTFGGTVTIGAGTSLVLTTNAAGQTVVVQQAGATTSTAKRTSSGLGGLINSGLGGSGSARPTQTVLSGSDAAAAATSSGAAVVGRGRVEGGLVGAVLGVLVAVV